MCSVDRKTRIVMRGRRAVALTFVEFAIFDALHHLGRDYGKRLQSKTLTDKVYNGVADPGSIGSIRVTKAKLNAKLEHVGLKVIGVNHNKYSFYQIVAI
jgi:DNA-binding response OmpR family regulator